eukprot:s206_g53.t1
MPSLAILNLVKDAVDANDFVWVPWKSRASESDQQLLTEQRRPRNDRQLLRSILAEGDMHLEAVPEAEVDRNAPIKVVLSKFQAFLTLAILGLAYLLVLKRFHAKFQELALARPRDQHLRGPSFAEILAADRTAWTTVADGLCGTKGSLNDVLNEVAFFFARCCIFHCLPDRPDPSCCKRSWTSSPKVRVPPEKMAIPDGERASARDSTLENARVARPAGMQSSARLWRIQPHVLQYRLHAMVSVSIFGRW